MNSLLKKKKISVVLILIMVFSFYFFARRDTTSTDTINLKFGIIKAQDSISNVQIANKEMVQVRFSWEVGGIVYNDALNIIKEDYVKLTSEDIEQMKNERFQTWVKVVNESGKK